MNNINKVVSREDIINQTSLKKDTKNRTIDMHISNIRFKINDDSKEFKYIKSIWGIGYKFINDN
jgi:DNA-binding response OmpR family regulator